MPAAASSSVELLQSWGVPSRLATNAGYEGCFAGFVTDLARTRLQSLSAEELDQVQIFGCGPTGMLAATADLARQFDLPCQLALEEYMACAVGGCAGCTVLLGTPDGPAMKRVCVDGPVFDAWPGLPGLSAPISSRAPVPAGTDKGGSLRADRQHPMRSPDLATHPRRLRRDETLVEQSAKILLQRPHAVGPPGLDGRIHLRNLALSNEVADRGRRDHDFMGRNTSSAAAPEQRLSDHRAQRLGEHTPDHGFLRSRENFHDTIDSLGRRTGMKRRQYQMAGFRGGQCQPDGFQIAQLADEYDVRVLAQCRSQGDGGTPACADGLRAG